MAELSDHASPWMSIAWAMSGENAAEAQRIIDEVPLHNLMLWYGMKHYAASFEPDLDD